MKKYLMLLAVPAMLIACNKSSNSPSADPVAETAGGPSASPAPTQRAEGRLSQGMWGGEHIALSIYDNTIAYELDCGYGSIDEPISIDANGNFRVVGTMNNTDIPDYAVTLVPVPAVFEGTVIGNTMTLNISWTQPAVAERPGRPARPGSPSVPSYPAEPEKPMKASFTLIEGQGGNIVRCD